MAFPLFCDSCGADYPERSRMSAFGLLGLPRSFAIPDIEFDRRELLLAQRLHPDRWMSRSERLHRKALMAQSAVNVALESVRDPFRRAETLLALTDEHRSGALDAAANSLPPGFLIEHLELREEIQEGPSDDRRRALKKAARAQLRGIEIEIGDAFEELDAVGAAVDPAAARAAALNAVAGAVSRSRYWRNLQTALRGDAPR